MGFFDIFRDQTKDIIRWENPDSELLVWQWPQNLDEIKSNSSLIVDPGLASIFIHNGKLEAIQKDSGKWSLETDNIPFLSSLKNIMSGFETHDKASVYFVKLNQITNQKWGTPNSITYVDPIYDFPVELRAFGNFSFKILDIENFWINYVSNREIVSVDDIRMIVVDRIVGHIANSFANKKVSYNEVDSKTIEIAKDLMDTTKFDFLNLGLELTDFRIEDINFTEKTQDFIDRVISKSADVAAVNKTKNIDKEAMINYSDLEKLNIAGKAAESGGSAGDMMGAGIGMAMGMNMANKMDEKNEDTTSSNTISSSDKLKQIKNMLDEGLITEQDYDNKKNKILSNI